MTWRRIIVGVGVAMVLGLTFSLFHPYGSYDPARVDRSLLDLSTPYRSVEACYFWDGGSIGIELVDRDGKRQQFAIPAHMGDTDPHSRVFVGALHDRHAGAVEVADPEHTKHMLVRILADKTHRTPDEDAWLAILSRRPMDYAAVLLHRLRGHYDD
ncbi:MAG: hypothetical protein ACYDC1_25905 [Limisphaerales bacterium]